MVHNRDLRGVLKMHSKNNKKKVKHDAKPPKIRIGKYEINVNGTILV